jgi:bifunctional N-acetylglucosamine-1-phosphate-uridyltransferase/glucosamine-1-phosphate-acetyltransferase GlmU-like protein
MRSAHPEAAERGVQTGVDRLASGGGAINTMFIAPVSLGAGAFTAAGSVITDDVTPGSPVIAGAQQTNSEDHHPSRRLSSAR